MKTPDHTPPIERLFDLNRLSEAGYEASIAPGADDLAKIARWADVAGVSRFEGQVTLRRRASDRFAYAAHLEADITQACTVTLEPVASHIALDFARTLHLVPHARKTVDFSSELSPGAGDDEAPEEIESSRFDLAAPLLEEFLLAIDPYPRAPGASFETEPTEKVAQESPFAVLKSLKSGG